MDITERAQELTKHVTNPSIRSRAAKNIRKLLADLETIISYADDDIVEQQWVEDGKDGVPLTSVEQLEHRESEKVSALKQANQLFPPDECPAGIEITDKDSLNTRHKFGYTPLHLAVVDEDEFRVMELLEMGADPNIRDNSGATPYQKAINRGYTEIAEMLRTYTHIEQETTAH